MLLLSFNDVDKVSRNIFSFYIQEKFVASFLFNVIKLIIMIRKKREIIIYMWYLYIKFLDLFFIVASCL